MSAAFNFEEKKLQELQESQETHKEADKKVQERVKNFQISGAFKRYCSGDSKAIYTTSG